MNLTFMYWEERGYIYILRQYMRHLLLDVRGPQIKWLAPLSPPPQPKFKMNSTPPLQRNMNLALVYVKVTSGYGSKTESYGPKEKVLVTVIMVAC